MSLKEKLHKVPHLKSLSSSPEELLRGKGMAALYTYPQTHKKHSFYFIQRLVVNIQLAYLTVCIIRLNLNMGPKTLTLKGH